MSLRKESTRDAGYRTPQIVEACSACERVLGVYDADAPAFYALPPEQCPTCRDGADR